MATSQLHEDFSREEHVKAGSDRGFGFVFAGFFAIVSAISLWRSGTTWHWALPLAAAFLLVALVYPRLLGPLNRLWLKFGLLLYKVMNPLVLGHAVLRDHHADRPGHAGVRQGFPAAAARRQCQELLDRPHPAGAAAAVDAQSILILGKDRIMGSIIVELWAFMRERKKFWLLPIMIMMVIFGGLIVLTKGSAIAPFIYTLF